MLLDRGSECCVKVLGITNVQRWNQLNCLASVPGFDFSPTRRAKRSGSCDVSQHCDASNAWHRLLQKLHALPVQFRRDNRQAGQVRAWMRETRNELRPDRIANNEHDRNRRRRSLSRQARRRTYRDQRIRLESHEVGCELREPLGAAITIALVEHKIRMLDIA